MSREARVVSPTGIYHVVVRGINKQRIFEDDKDNFRMLRIIRECKEIYLFELYAFCLMGNHMHLLMRVRDVAIGRVMKVIGTKYVLGFNLKYDRNGSLFQGRFSSKPVKTIGQFARTVRYIHQNPVMAGMCNLPGEHFFSSFGEYLSDLEGSSGNSGKSCIWDFVDKAYTYEVIPRERFIEFNSILKDEDEDENIQERELEPRIRRMTDDKACLLMARISGCSNVSEFQAMETGKRTRYLREMKNKRIPVSQIIRITGLSRGVINKVK